MITQKKTTVIAEVDGTCDHDRRSVRSMIGRTDSFDADEFVASCLPLSVVSPITTARRNVNVGLRRTSAYDAST